MIIGITGTNASGKGTLVKILEKDGFEHFSVRNFLIEEIQKKGFEINRDNMVNVGNELREKFGPGYIMERLYHKRSKNKLIIENTDFSTSEEIEYQKTNKAE